MSAHLYSNVYIRVGMARALAVLSDFGLLGAKFTKMGHSLLWSQLNHRSKFDAASFILGGEIRNRTNTQTNTQTNSNVPIYPHLVYRHVWIITI